MNPCNTQGCHEYVSIPRYGLPSLYCPTCLKDRRREQSRRRVAAYRSRTAKKHGVVTNLVHEIDSRIKDAGSPKLLEPEAPKPDESQGSQDALPAVQTLSDSVRTVGPKTIQVSASAVEAMPDWMKAKILEFQKAHL